jgi:hypothetical protein
MYNCIILYLFLYCLYAECEKMMVEIILLLLLKRAGFLERVIFTIYVWIRNFMIDEYFYISLGCIFINFKPQGGKIHKAKNVILSLDQKSADANI